MPLVLTAKITFDPRRIIEDRWTHDIAHVIVAARAMARLRERSPRPLPHGRPR